MHYTLTYYDMIYQENSIIFYFALYPNGYLLKLGITNVKLILFSV